MDRGGLYETDGFNESDGSMDDMMMDMKPDGNLLQLRTQFQMHPNLDKLSEIQPQRNLFIRCFRVRGFLHV